MMSARRREHGDGRRDIIALMLGVLGVVACDAGIEPLSIPRTQRTAERVGVVERVEPRTGAPLLHLVGGASYDPTGASPIVQIGSLEVGSLVLAGTQPTPWWASMLEHPLGCFAIVVRGRDEGATIATEIGIRLTKAPGFSAPHSDGDGLYDRPNEPFCLDRDGRVLGYGLIGYGPTPSGSADPIGSVVPSTK
jgi:hypothetical protein